MAEGAVDYGVADFWSNGFALVRGVFAPAEVARWRAAAEAMPADRDLLSDPVLRALLLDPRVLGIARAILGEGALLYCGDSNVLAGATDAGFHKDNADKDDPNAPDWHGRYPLIRFGLYGQDHRRSPDGLDLRRGSHEHCSVTAGEHVFADLALGDLAVWNLRTSHSGGSMMLRDGTPLDPASWRARLLRRWPMGRLAVPAPNRIGIFWSVGTAGAHYDRYVAYLKTREYAVGRWRGSAWDADARTAAAAAGVTLRDVAAEIAEEPARPLHRAHVPLAY